MYVCMYYYIIIACYIILVENATVIPPSLGSSIFVQMASLESLM